jgi:hypothetical protein
MATIPVFMRVQAISSTIRPCQNGCRNGQKVFPECSQALHWTPSEIFDYNPS